MKLPELKTSGEYIPAWNNNKNLGITDQVKVYFSWPTYSSQIDLQVGKITLDDESGVSDKRFLRRVIKLVSGHVTKITGLEEYGILDGKSLVDAPADLSELALEIFFHIMAGQGISDKKKDTLSHVPTSSKVGRRKKNQTIMTP